MIDEGVQSPTMRRNALSIHLVAWPARALLTRQAGRQDSRELRGMLEWA